MKKFIWIGVVACIFNLLAALLISTYTFQHMGLTSMVIVLSTVLCCLTYYLKINETYRTTLLMIFSGIGIFEYISGWFAPTRWQDNLWLIIVLLITALELLLLFFATYYSRKK